MKIIGIYKISSKQNPYKFYIGSSVDIKNRWNLHLARLRQNKHHSPILQAHANKYGIDDFKFEILEYCEREEILTREQYFINTLNPCLNVCKIAGNHLGRKCSPESIERMKIAKNNISEETRKRISISAKARGWPNRILVMSEEQKEKIRQSAMGNKYNLGHKRSEETKRKMSIALKGKAGRPKGFKLAEETKKKIGLANSGRVMSEEQKRKISETKRLKNKQKAA